MPSYDTLLADARYLSVTDRIQLIEATLGHLACRKHPLAERRVARGNSPTIRGVRLRLG